MIMTSNDLLKLARSGYFQIIRTRVDGDKLEIKRLKALMTPVWTVWYKCSTKSEFKYWHEFLLSKPEILDATKEFTPSDLNRIQENGFRIIRRYDVPNCVKIRDAKTFRWKIIGKFRSIAERNQRIDELLNDNYTVLL